MENVICNNCGSTQAEKRFTLHDYMLDRLSVNSTLVHCLHCGLVYQNPRLSLEELRASYPDNYEPFIPLDQSKTFFLFHWIRNRGLQKRISTVTKYKSGGCLLDIGCASGSFLSALLVNPNWSLYGVEPNPSAAEAARLQPGLRIFTGTLDQITYPENYFDVVTMWDVLEHLPDPCNTLLEIHRILKPGGLIILKLPNLDSLEAKVFGKYWAGLDAPRHLFVFNKMTIRKMLAKNKFQISEIKTGIGSFPNFILSLQFWMTAHQIRSSQRKKILSVLKFLLVRTFLAPFFYLVDQAGYGSYMIIVSYKNLPTK
jgi:2-polyprenyl-3-methyl-5-hydroxy-6-metoxy-1,4-benzoquinol methylase